MNREVIRTTNGLDEWHALMHEEVLDLPLFGPSLSHIGLTAVNDMSRLQNVLCISSPSPVKAPQ